MAIRSRGVGQPAQAGGRLERAAHLPGLVRIQFSGRYSTAEEVDLAVHALRNIAAGNRRHVRAGSRRWRVRRAHVPPGVGAVLQAVDRKLETGN